MDLTIHPHQGVGPLRFGMAPEDAVRAMPALGQPHRTKTRFDGSIREFRNLADPSLAYVDGKLRDIECTARVPRVFFEDLEVFAVDPKRLVERLYLRNGGALFGLGSLLFVNLGLNTTGFYIADKKAFFAFRPDEEDTRSVDAFAPGAFDALIPEFEPITLAFK